MPHVLLPKAEKLWKDFEETRKSEWLKATETGRFNLMVKEAKPFKLICQALDNSEEVVMDALGDRKGKTREEAPYLLKAHVSTMNVLRKGTFKSLARATLDEMDKVSKPKTYRALKVLITGIDEIVSLAEYVEGSLKKNVAENGKKLEREEMVAKVASMSLAQVKKAVMKALAELQKVKAKPTPASWDLLISAGGTRDLCMALVSLEAAQAKGGFADLPDAKIFKIKAQPFNTSQPKTTLASNAQPQAVLERAKEWSTIVKQVADSYQAHW